MEYFDKATIEDINATNTDKYYVPAELFDGVRFRLVRLEVKWAFVACLDVLRKHPLYDDEDNAYLSQDEASLPETLAAIANKKVDQAKVDGYLNELEEAELVERQDGRIYLRRLVSIF